MSGIFKYVKLKESAKAPEKASGDACYDLSYCGKESITIFPGCRELIPTGLILVFPPGYHGIIKPRSGLAWKNGLDVLAGVIDNSYDKETQVVLINLGIVPYSIEPGDRIAQIYLCKDSTFKLEEITLDQLQETGRGSGFGSSGR